MIPVDLVCDMRSPSGYSAHAREFAVALAPLVDLKLEEHKHDVSSIKLDPGMAQLFKALESKTRPPKVRIEFQTPEFFTPREGCLNIGFTQWETTRIYDSSTVVNPLSTSTEGATEERFNWVKQMNRMDMMFTACEMAKQAFKDSGVTVPIHVVQGPINTETYSPDSNLTELQIMDVNIDRKTREWIPREERPIIIGCMAQWTIRKNMDALLTAILTRFHRDDVTLLLKTYGSVSGNDKEADKLYEHVRMRRRLIANPDAPRIVLITEKITDEQVAAFYKTVDIYCSTSRGEGFCMPIVQAMSSGVVPVSNGFSAPADYITPGKNGFLVDYTLAPAVGQTHTPWYTYKQDWGNVDMNDLINKLKEACKLKKDCPEIWTAMQQNTRQAVIDRMSHEPIGKRAAKLIEEALQLVATGA